MEGIAKGWVFKQSRFLKRWQKEWMVLSAQSLATFKSLEDASDMTNISVKEIKSVSQVSVKGGMNGFKVTTDKQEFVFYSEEAAKWIQSVEQLLSSPFFPKRMNSDVEIQEKVKELFRAFKQQINDREQQLLSINDTHFSLSLQKAQNQISNIEEDQRQIDEKYSDFKQASKKLPVPKLEALTACSREIEKNEIKISIETNSLQKIVMNSLKLECVNPSERSVVRSNITRALKWRYSGDKIDALSFSVSQDVLLTGVGVCRPYRAGGQISVQKFSIVNGQTIESRAVYVHKKNCIITHSNEESVYKIPLQTPVVLKKNTVYTVCFIIEGTPSYKCVDCQSICVVGDFSWEFFNTEFSTIYKSNRTDAVCGPIASFFFMSGK